MAFNFLNNDGLNTLLKYLKQIFDNKMDKTNPTGTGSFSLNRKADTTIGNYSFTEGYNTTASGKYSHAEGFLTTASIDASHAEGYNTTANGAMSHAEGYMTTTGGNWSHAGGFHSESSGGASFTHGNFTQATQPSQFTIGYGNNPQTDSIFEVGNGLNKKGEPYNYTTIELEPATRQNAFRVTQDGKAIAQTDVQLADGTSLSAIKTAVDAIPTVNNATLTIQRNGTTVQTFTSNQSTNATANISVPTKVGDLTNDKGYTTNTGDLTSEVATDFSQATTPQFVEDLDNLKGDITHQAQRITNLENASKGILYDTVTDSTEAYVKSIQSGAVSGYGMLDNVGGKSYGGYATVDLGSLSWETDTSGHFYAPLTTVKNYGVNELAKIYTNKYTTVTSNTVSDKCISSSNKYIGVYDSGYTSVSLFKASLNGVMLLYEQSTPSQIIDVTVDKAICKKSDGTVLDTINLPTTTLKGINSSVYDIADFENGKVVRKVGVVDLGSLSWSYDSGGYFYSTSIREDYKGSSNLLCALYEYSSEPMSTAPNMSIQGGSSNKMIFIKNTSYTSASAFKTAMNGVKLYYELATSTEETLSTDEIIIPIEPNGTITFNNAYGVSVPNSITYNIHTT